MQEKTITFRIHHYQYSETIAADPGGGGGISSGAPWGSSDPRGNPAYDSYITSTDWSFTLNENWRLSLQYMQVAIRAGTSYKRAEQKYPELNI